MAITNFIKTPPKYPNKVATHEPKTIVIYDVFTVDKHGNRLRASNRIEKVMNKEFSAHTIGLGVSGVIAEFLNDIDK